MTDPQRQDGWYYFRDKDGSIQWKIAQVIEGLAYVHGSLFKFGNRHEVGPRIPMPDEPIAPERPAVDLEALEPRDLLTHLRQWLVSHRELHTKHFGESDQSGHPHGYAGVVIPEWDVRQRLDEIDTSLALPALIQHIEALEDEVRELRKDREQERERLRKAVASVLGGMGPTSAVWGNSPYDRAYCNGVTAALTAFNDECKRIAASMRTAEEQP